MGVPSNTPPSGRVTPGSLVSLGAYYYKATLKLPQCSRLMELRESADGLRWAIGRAGAMAVIWVQMAKPASRAVGKTEPDLHLIKQVKQVTMSGSEGLARRFAGIQRMEIR